MGARTEARGGIHVEDGLEWYRIDGVDHLAPFLVNVTAPDDHWLFFSSAGALTAGRRNADRAIFPYETDDRLHRSGGRTGPVTVVRVDDGSVWEPFAGHVPFGVVERSLAKTIAGDRLRFTERHPDLGLTFRSTWSSSRIHGLVRTCELALDADADPLAIELLDGLVDVLPAGVELAMQQASSTLVDAYRRSEVDPETGLAVFSLEAAISDQPMAAEAMTANVVWSRGLEGATIALSDRQLRDFRSGAPLRPEPLVTGLKGAFLQSARAAMAPGDRLAWVVVGGVALDHVAVAGLRHWLLDAADPVAEVQDAVDRSHDELVDLAARQGALQRSGDRETDGHHFANVLYNAMRGGAFLEDHRVELASVSEAIAVRNLSARDRFDRRIAGLDREMPIDELRRRVADDPELVRLVNEYLPLTFSRRHGDPSRPWNRFEIGSASGARATTYEGNWRDIFQNWEALLHRFPDYLESAVSKFLSASTRDGHNPYRINQDGIDWEVPEDTSWGNFGYWGDHQVVYLHRLLDAWDRFHPGTLETCLDRRAFAHADVPYRLRPYSWIVKDPKRTLEFDASHQATIDRRVAERGTDGRLVPGADGEVHHASLAEKLVVSALAKVGNLVPGGGIWMNTQRPEWNDANNALVGNGVSVVTAFQLRDYLAFLLDLLDRSPVTTVPIDPAVEAWLLATWTALDGHRDLLDPAAIDPGARRSLLDALGLAYGDYRARVYDAPPAEPSSVPVDDIAATLRAALQHVEVVTTGARRDDGLFDSYRLLVLDDGTAEIRELYVMLEGQVAALASPAVDDEQAADLLDALFASELHREDHDSFVLYPPRSLPSFLDRNRVPDDLLTTPIEDVVTSGAGILRRDADGVVRFSADVANAEDLEKLLADAGVDAPTRAQLLELHEAVFDHRSFTGRSQSMYRYEGLGSIYWHMVAKLLAAVQDRLVEADDGGADAETLGRLRAAYRRIRDGFGYRRPVAQQGAFPLDPHSHTPAHAGAPQPGMTGAVKEGVLLRLGELGVSVHDGCVRFAPRLLEPSDFLAEPVTWSVGDEDLQLGVGTIGFTWCGVPIVYHLADEPWFRVVGAEIERSGVGEVLDRATSRLLLSRSGAVHRIDVGVRRPTERD